MRRRLTWPVAETLPERAEVLERMGAPPASARPRVRQLLEGAIEDYLVTAEPQAVVAEISRDRFREVYRGEGRNAPETPLAAVFPRADRLALFVATVGGRVTARIREEFDRGQPARAGMLDAVASVAADRLSVLLGALVPAILGGDGAAHRALAYSPGYCGWDVTGQRALFAALGPADIGVSLNASCLMDPLKSVSGVLVAGPAAIHRFAPTYPFCAECRDKPCRGRIRSLSRPGEEGR